LPFANATGSPILLAATRIFQNIGGAFGSAILSTVVQSQMTKHASDPQVVAGAFNVAFWWTAAFTIVAVIPALFLPMHGSEV
jgi:hypothetical protein